jgi:hypothetical protein
MLFHLRVTAVVWSALILGCGWLQAGQVSQITQYDFTWTFSQPVTAGQYVTGDWWVVGPVTVTSVTPAPTDGMNGSVVNPKAGTTQGYDNRGPNYDASMTAQYPVTLAAGQSLVSTESLAHPGDVPPDSISHKGHPEDVLRAAAVLTCVSVAPAADAFRPAYVGDWRETYRVSQLRRDLLPALDPPATLPDLTALNHSLERIWLDHKADFTSGYFHPLANMPEYGRDMTTVISQASLEVLLKNPDETTLERLVQKGIDWYGVVLSNNNLWVANGGHDSGRKWPIIFAGIMLGNDKMMHVSAAFAEDQQTYYGKRFGSDATGGLFTISPGAPNEKHEETDPATWATDGKGINNGSRAENYRKLNGPTWMGEALAGRLMGAMDLWDHPPFFDYVDRWVKEEPVKMNHPFEQAMWTEYRDKADALGTDTKKKLTAEPAPTAP